MTTSPRLPQTAQLIQVVVFRFAIHSERKVRDSGVASVTLFRVAADVAVCGEIKHGLNLEKKE
jgi:hypothetical protein